MLLRSAGLDDFMRPKWHNKVIMSPAKRAGWDSLLAASLCSGCPYYDVMQNVRLDVRT